MVQLPSLGTVVAAAIRTLRRFPLVLAAAALAALAAILMADDVGPMRLRDPLLAAALLAIPLGTAVQLTLERRTWHPALRLVPWALAFAALAAVYMAWPDWPDRMRVVRFAQLAAAFHLAVAFLPFQGRYTANAFWQYNRVLFVRFLGAGVSSATFFAGLALALAAVDQLFGVDVPESGYFRLWVVIAFVFNTWFFLGGVPEDPNALETRREYRAALRVFAQYTLVPLVSVYLVILSLYLVKVVVTWDWPSGWIGWLVSGVATAGILTLLLVRPIADDPGQKWVAAFARIFWLAVLPAVVMLWLALYQRIAQYGITEPRYILLILSLWLAAMAGWYTLTRSRDMRLVPLSLCALAVVAYAGPWGAYAVSARSQAGRLTAVLERNGLLEAGGVPATQRRISDDDAREVSAVVRYLAGTHGTGRLAPLFTEETARRLNLGYRGSSRMVEPHVRAVVAALGVPYREQWDRPGAPQHYFRVNTRRSDAIALAGFDVLVRVRPAEDSILPDTGVTAHVVPDARVIRVRRGTRLLLDVPLDSVLAFARRTSGAAAAAVAPLRLHVEAEGPRARASVWLRTVSGQDSADVVRPTLVIGEVLVDLRP